MSLPPDQPPSLPPPNPKLSAEERRARQADRLKTIRLRMTIGRELEDQGITNPRAIGEALGMPASRSSRGDRDRMGPDPSGSRADIVVASNRTRACYQLAAVHPERGAVGRRGMPAVASVPQ